jgi:sulfate transporter 4
MSTFEDEVVASNSDIDGVNPSPEQGDSERERLIFQSIHRRNLNHIATDEIQSKRYSVPEVGSGRKPFRTIARELMTEHMRPRSRDEWIGTFIPCYTWLRTYDWRAIFLTDILAGIAVGVMAVPQSLSYAKLADLPVEYGLYSALFPIWAYSVFGSSRQLAVGPVALVSLMLGTGLNNEMAAMGISKDDPTYYDVRTTLAIQTSLLVGILNIVMGLVRLGFVTIFMSHAVISGFISGASVIIGMSQLKGILGVQAEGDNVQKLLASIFASIGSFNYKTFLMGMSSLATLILFKQASKRYPKQKWLRAIGPIFVTTITILVTWGFNLSANGIPVVKYIPAGFPAFTVGRWTPIKDFGAVITTALSITIIGFMESIAIAKSLAAKHKYELDSSTELIGLGVANFVGSMFQAYPVTGSFSRSAVNDQSGARSGVSGMITALLVGMVLLFLTDVFEYMVSWFRLSGSAKFVFRL